MASKFRLSIPDGAQKIHHFLSRKMSHVEKVSEDVITAESNYTAVLVYEHYFSRVGNQVALVIIISGNSYKTTVKTISCGASRGFLGLIDWGASHDFASEPIEYLEREYDL